MNKQTAISNIDKVLAELEQEEWKIGPGTYWECEAPVVYTYDSGNLGIIGFMLGKSISDTHVEYPLEILLRTPYASVEFETLGFHDDHLIELQHVFELWSISLLGSFANLDMRLSIETTKIFKEKLIGIKTNIEQTY